MSNLTLIMKEYNEKAAAIRSTASTTQYRDLNTLRNRTIKAIEKSEGCKGQMVAVSERVQTSMARAIFEAWLA